MSAVTVNTAWLGGDEDGADPETGLPEGVYTEQQADGGLIPPERAELFRVDGKVFTVLKKPPPQFLFRALRSIRKADSEMAEMGVMAGLLFDVLGEPVMNELADNTSLGQEEIDQVMKAAQKYTSQIAKRTLGN